MTDGLRLATVFDRAKVDRSPVMDCAQRLGTERLPRLVENHLDEVSLVIDESSLPFHIWDALVAVCLEDAPRLEAGGGDLVGDQGRATKNGRPHSLGHPERSP